MEPLGAAPSTGASWASTAISLMLVAPSAIATADTTTTPRLNCGNVPARASAASRGQPADGGRVFDPFGKPVGDSCAPRVLRTDNGSFHAAEDGAAATSRPSRPR